MDTQVKSERFFTSGGATKKKSSAAKPAAKSSTKTAAKATAKSADKSNKKPATTKKPAAKATAAKKEVGLFGKMVKAVKDVAKGAVKAVKKVGEKAKKAVAPAKKKADKSAVKSKKSTKSKSMRGGVKLPSLSTSPITLPTKLSQVKPQTCDTIKSVALSNISNSQKTFVYNNKIYNIEKKDFQITSNSGFSDNNVWSYQYNIINSENIICSIYEYEHKNYINKHANANANAERIKANEKSNEINRQKNKNCKQQCIYPSMCNNDPTDPICVDDPSEF